MQAVSHDLRLVGKSYFLRGQNIIRVMTNKLENKTQIMRMISMTNMGPEGKKEWQDKLNQGIGKDVEKWEPSCTSVEEKMVQLFWRTI